ncbi:hypothetical protein [uncultured Victivallis sp.]|uniref:hypothetical protein n=1 Tax=uncultured Victivallis sp. TaxID=354118 RepID=UPI0025D97D26|nr:hypothetical protein [uncultured Victivallis sp.]
MRLKCSFLSACLIVSCGLSAGTLDFAKLSPTELVLPLQAKGQSVEAGTAGGRPALLLEWNCGEARWFSLNCKRSPRLPEFDRAEFSLEFFRPQESTVRRASLLLADRDNEVFQLTTPLPAGESGWKTVKFTLDPKAIQGNVWGGKRKNRIPDFPLRIAGVTCSYAATQGIESAALGQLTWELSPGTPPEAPSAVALPPGRELVDFSTLLDSEIDPRLGGKPVTAQRGSFDGRPGLALRRQDSTSPRVALGLLQKQELPKFDRAELTLELYRPTGSAAGGAAVTVSDRNGRYTSLYTPLPRAKGGWETLRFPLNHQKLTKTIQGKLHPPAFPLRLQSVVCNSRPPKEDAPIVLGKLMIHTLSAPLEASVETGDELHLVLPGKEKQVRLQLRNPGTAPRSVTAALRLFDPDDRLLLEKSGEFQIAGAAVQAIPLPPPERFGVYTVKLTLKEKDSLRHETLRYARLDPAGTTQGGVDGFLFGICSHLQRYPAEERRRMARAAALCGAKLLRVSLESHRIQPRHGEWTFGTYDHIAKLLREYQIEFAPIFLNLPSWAVAADYRQAVKSSSTRGRRPDYRLWEEYVRKVSEHYRSSLRFAEVWNEPDLIGFANFPPEEYLQLLKITSSVLRETVPGITVISAGFASPDLNPAERTADPHYVRKCVEGGRGLYDLFAVHMHTRPERYREYYVKNLLRFRKELNDTTPWYSNETALASFGEISELDQAETLFLNLFCAWNNGAAGYNWYNLRNIKEDPGDPEANYGMLTWDFQPKKVYAAYNTLARYFRGAKLLRHSESTPLFRAADGSWLIPCSPLEKRNRHALLLFTGIRGEATRIDLWGNREQLPVSGGIALLKSTGHPVILQVKGQPAPPEPAGELLRFAPNFRLLPGREVKSVVECRNPSRTPLKLDLTFRPPAGLAVTPANRSVTIPPGEDVSLSFSFRTDKNCRADSLPLDVSAGTIWKGTLALPLETVIPIPSGAFSREPQFRVNRPEQVTSFVSVEDATAHLQWKGPADLSAELFLARGDRELRLRMIVRDDIHHQPVSGRDVWQGDNVQLGLRLPRQNGQWEFGFTRLADGKPECFVWLHPEGYDPAKSLRQIRLSTRRSESAGETVYEAVIPFRAIGLTQEIGEEGFHLSFLVNDNDGTCRESAISASPGMLNKDSSRYPAVCF